MRIAQIILPGASEYERKCQRVDRAALAETHDVFVASIDDVAASAADVAHVYASGELPRPAFARFPVPYVSSAQMRPARWSLRRPVPPRAVVSPLAEKDGGGGVTLLPEAVEEHYRTHRPAPRAERETKVLGSFARPAVAAMVEQTLYRLHRFRGDVEWMLFDRIPASEDLSGVDAWVDPAIAEDDLDGFVAEALVVGVSVVASRTPINVLRLEKGRTGLLVPPRDPNELTHAILAALFKPEVAESRRAASRQTVSKFGPRQRIRVLAQLYDSTKP